MISVHHVVTNRVSKSRGCRTGTVGDCGSSSFRRAGISAEPEASEVALLCVGTFPHPGPCGCAQRRGGHCHRESQYPARRGLFASDKAPENWSQRTTKRPCDRLPRVTRWMALAIHFDALIRACEIENYAELARLGNVTRARVTQIINLLNLAPEIQEWLLFLSQEEKGRHPVVMSELQGVEAVSDWWAQAGVLCRGQSGWPVLLGRVSVVPQLFGCGSIQSWVPHDGSILLIVFCPSLV